MQESIVQEYVNMRNAGRFDLTVFWKMYQSEGGFIKNPQVFKKHFLYLVEILDGGVEINTARDIDQILLSVDKKLGLSVLYTKTGAFVKVC